VLHYDTALTAAPGAYALRVAVVGKDGRRGTVVQRIELSKQPADAIATSDLIVGTCRPRARLCRHALNRK
jgi:hypothetical protein